MSSSRFFVLIFLFLSSFALSSAADQSCSNFTFPDHNKLFRSCTDLPVLNSFLHWTYNPSSTTLRIAYRRSDVTSSTWVAWAINPKSKGMIGSQAIVAYPKPDGTMIIYTSPVNSYRTQMTEGNLSVAVYDLSATYLNDEITIFATLVLPNNSGTINHVWQDGPLAGDSLGMHQLSGDHLQSTASLNLTSGTTVTAKGGDSRATLRNVHGMLNVFSWGIMMPVGFMIARYMKAFQPDVPTWFYLHVSLQCSAFVIGIAGCVTGLVLGHMSPGVHHHDHMAIGTTVFCLGVLQVLALFLRPKKDHKYRHYWNIYHHYTGYAVLILGVANIFLGFGILKPAKIWKIAYYVVFGALVFITIVLEVCKRCMKEKEKNSTDDKNGRA
ncbi:hypothetical protein F0562_018782 [Nyssa sinensis]|uniref:Cytochrome b561 and DOMON domain-containing protein n=1 Tax=Nyssa sinensis TaxID=561372 RepID=A0A5J4ZE63_9ASTE|nr:hypothetical protein F0562_018782 [Nyssa sinensis]